jgi:hypothetical protein
MSIPKRDPNFTTAELNRVADDFLAAGKRYWEAAHRAGINGAVIWIEDTDGRFVLFTRGEYRETIMRNVHEIGPTRQLGAVQDSSEE